MSRYDVAVAYAKKFDEADHPRGQPDNAGEFTKSKGSTPTKDKPASRATKADIAKSAHVYVGREVQRYSEEHNEPRMAKALKGVSFPDNEPVDIAIPGPDGVLKHGMELKTITNNSNGKITMDTYAQVRKVNWEKANQATFHTVVIDDTDVFNAKGPGKHDESKRVIYYRRGVAGSARIGGMYRVKDLAELKTLMEAPEKTLPDAAKRTDNHLRDGTWKPIHDEDGKGFANKKLGKIVRPKK